LRSQLHGGIRPPRRRAPQSLLGVSGTAWLSSVLSVRSVSLLHRSVGRACRSASHACAARVHRCSASACARVSSATVSIESTFACTDACECLSAVFHTQRLFVCLLVCFFGLVCGAVPAGLHCIASASRSPFVAVGRCSTAPAEPPRATAAADRTPSQPRATRLPPATEPLARAPLVRIVCVCVCVCVCMCVCVCVCVCASRATRKRTKQN
jgi:hypothetical protein